MELKGITILLHEKVEVGKDAFNNPLFEDTVTSVENVLVAPATTDDITTSTNFYGKKAIYTLGIPKGDTHNWIDAEIEFFGQRFKSFGFPIEGIESMIPLSWNKKVMVEVYG